MTGRIRSTPLTGLRVSEPTILEADGKPAFVILPYKDYVALTSQPRIPVDDTIPHEVIERMVRNRWSIVRAWRDYLGLTQAELAERLGVRQPSYLAMEAPGAKLRRSTKERIAEAMGLSVEQISV